MSEMNEEIISSPTDDQLDKLNWPALVFPLIWCFFHRLYLLGFIAIIPIAQIIIGFYLLFKGNRLDWEVNKDRGVEVYFMRRKKWNRATATIVICSLIIGSSAAAYKALNDGFLWKQYSFENGKLFVHLPFELKNKNTIISNETIAYGQSYQASNGQINISLSFTELKAEYGFVLSEMFNSSLESLQNAKDIQVISHTYERFKYNNYPAGKMTIEFISKGIKYTSEYVYIIVVNNKCWYLSCTYQTEDRKSKEKSDKIFNSIRVK